MERGNFFERMERELNLQHEYEKIDSIILNEKIKGNTIDDIITYFLEDGKIKRILFLFMNCEVVWNFCIIRIHLILKGIQQHK